MKPIARILFALLMITALLPLPAESAPRCEIACETGRECRPYGGYCRNRRQGWYGGRREVRTAEAARELLREYFAGSRATIGELREKDTYFESDIRNPRGKIVDRVIIDKRSGRIRSTY
jgi:hypothetical protein